jgi:sigma-B regulation protein RsbU (phosphoserine phosphatase)
MSSPGDRSRLRTLLDAAHSLGSIMEHDELLRDILFKAMAVMNAEASSVFIADPERRELVMHIPLGSHAEHLQSFRIPDTKGIAGAVFHGRRVLNVPDVREDPRFCADADNKSGFITRAVLCAPLLHLGTCMGVVQVLNPRDTLAFDGTDQEFFEGFAMVVSGALVRLHVQEQRALQRRSEQELAIARDIQESFLRIRIPPTSCVRCACHYRPALTVSGDFYAVQEFPDRRVLVLVGDVSGKGVPAALTMARTTAEIRAMPPPAPDLGEWMSRLNNVIVHEISGGRFIASSALLFDPVRQCVEVAVCGQFPPWHWSAGKWSEAAAPSHLALGILPDARMISATFPLKKEEKWLLFSDGVPEARNSAQEEFTLERLASALSSDPGSRGVLAHLAETLHSFVGGAKLHDDITCLAVEWRGEPPEARWELPAIPESLREIRHRIEGWTQFLGYSDREIGEIVLAVDEACANIVRHAYRATSGPIQCHVECSDAEWILALRDFGVPADPAQIAGRDVADVRPGGLGCHFIRHAFSRVEYTPLPDGTRLVLAKALPSSRVEVM